MEDCYGLLAFLLDLSSKLCSPFLCLLKVLLRGLEDNGERIERDTDTGLHLEQTTLDVLDTLTRPAVRAEDTSVEATVDDGIDASDDVPDGRKGLTNEGRRAEENTPGLTDGFHDLVKRSVDDVVHLNIHAILLQSGSNGVSKCLGELVGSCIRDDNERVARTLDGSGPATIELDVILQILTEDGTMAAADGVIVDVLELVKTVEHVLLEGTEDAVEVVLVSAEHVLLHLRILGDHIIEHKRVAVVGTEEVTGDDGLELRNVGDHGIRPVKELADDELEGVTTDVNGSRLVVDGHGLGELLVADVLNVPQSNGGTHNCGIRILVHQQSKRTAVIRLSMIQNNVVNLLIGLQDSLNPLFKLCCSKTNKQTR